MKFRSNQAIYLQIGDYIRENILRKEWRSGDRIPSIREMAVNVEVNPNTVMRTYTDLQDKGIIYNKRGIGYFVAPDAYQKTKQMERAEFIQKDLPAIFKKLDLLDMQIDDLKSLYNEYHSK